PAGTGGASMEGGSTSGGSGNGGGGSSGASSGGGSGASGAGGGGGACASPGAPATSPVDHHCEADSGPIVQATGTCVSGTVDAGSGADGGGGPEPLPGPWGGTSASDDDCKYDVSYTFTSICENQDVTFTVTLKSR